MKVFIDAGHNNSGWNTGAVGNGLREQDITFEVGRRLGDILTAQSLDIKLSRPIKTTNLGTTNASSINARYTMANQWGADLFISIHCNAGGGTGTETLYYSARSLKFATDVQMTFTSAMGLRSRGVKYRNDLGVLMYTNMPSILVELAFIDTYADALVLRDKQQEMAEALALGICGHLGIEMEDDEMAVKRYKFLADMPEWAQPTIKKLMLKGYLNGNDTDGLDLTLDMIRLFVVNDRAGIYGD